jgi:hypothetical protein
MKEKRELMAGQSRPSETLRGDLMEAQFDSAGDLEDALKRAAAAHGRHEERTGHADEEWPAWYAQYMWQERTGGDLPS